MTTISRADMTLANEVVDEFLATFYVPSVFNDGALRRRIACALARARTEEQERCAKACEANACDNGCAGAVRALADEEG